MIWTGCHVIQNDPQGYRRAILQIWADYIDTLRNPLLTLGARNSTRGRTGTTAGLFTLNIHFAGMIMSRAITGNNQTIDLPETGYYELVLVVRPDAGASVALEQKINGAWLNAVTYSSTTTDRFTVKNNPVRLVFTGRASVDLGPIVYIEFDPSAPEPTLDKLNLKGLPQTLGAPAGFGDLATVVSAAVYTATPPAALTLLPTELAGLFAIKQAGGVTCNVKPKDLFDVSAITNTYYVDGSRADNSGAGISWATAKKSIRAAIDAANASGLPSKIAVKSGVYSRGNGFNTSGTGITTAVPMYVYSVYGRVLTGNFDELVYTKTGGQTYVWQTTRSLVNSAYNPQLDRSYKGVASIALCDAEAGTFYTDNTTLYVHAHTSGVVSLQNCLPNLNANGCIFIGNQNVMLQGFDFCGGMAGGVSFSGGSTNVCILDDCTSKRAIGGLYASRTAQNGVVVLGCGIFAAFNSEASLNSNDGFNIHKDGAEVRPFSLFVNSKGLMNGTLPTSVSNNGYSVHDGCHSIDIGCVWTGNVGTGSGHINDGTVVWSFGSVAGMSDGDVVNGGSVTWGAFGAWSGACETYLDSCTDIGSSIGVYAAGGGTAYVRNHSGSGQLVGNVLPY